MPPTTCSRCDRPVSVMTRDVQTGLCPRCRAADAQAEQAAIFDGLRRFENRVFGLMLYPAPMAWRPGLERALFHARFRGVMKLVGGLIIAVLTFLITVGFGMLTGYHVASALVALPLAISMVGLMEIVLGIEFTYLAKRFDQGGFFVKTGIASAVLCFVAAYVTGGVLIYQKYFQ